MAGGVNVGRLYATLDLDSSRFVRGLSAARGMLAGLRLGTLAQGFSSIVAYAGAAATALQALGGAGAVLSSIAPAALLAVPAVMGLAQAFGTLKLAFSGVGSALSAGMKAAKGGGGGGGGGDTAAAAKARAEAIRDAEWSLMLSRERAADAVQQAERRNISAQREATAAQRDLNRARQDALQRMQDLRREVERSSLSEREAALSLRDAERELARVQGDGTSTADDRERAILAYERAKLSLADTREEIDENKRSLAEMTAKGVDGQEDVIAAQERAQEAAQAVTETQVDGQRSVRDALHAVEEAEESLASAREASATAGAAGVDAYADALKDLPPKTQEFVRFLVGLKPQFDKLKTAASEMFPGIIAGIKQVLPNLSILESGIRKTALEIGSVASDAGALFSTAQFQADLSKIMDNNATATGNFFRSIASVVRGLFSIGAAGAPILNQLSVSAASVADKFRVWADEANRSGQMSVWIQTALANLRQLGRIVGDVAEGIGNLLGAFSASGSGALTTLETLSRAFVKLTENQALIGIIQQLAAAFSGTLGSALSTVFSVLEQLLPSIQQLAPLFSQLMPIFMLFATGPLGPILKILGAVALMGPALTELAGPVGELAVAFGQGLSEAMTYLKPVLAVVAKALGEVLRAVAPLLPTVGRLVGIVASLIAPLAQVAGQLLVTFLNGLTPLLPVLEEMAAQLVEGLSQALLDCGPLLANMITQMMALLPALLPLIPAITDIVLALLPLVPKAVELWTVFQTMWIPILIPLIEILVRLAVVITDRVIPVVVWLISKVLDIATAMAHAAQWVAEKGGELIGWFASLPGKIQEKLSGAKDAITQPFKDAFNKVAEYWNNTIGGRGFKAPGWVPGVGGKGFTFPTMPYLAKGGTIASAGLAMVGERGPEILDLPGGASVIPLPRGGAGGSGGGTTIIAPQFTGPVYADSAGLARLARDIAVPIRNELNRHASRNGGSTGLVA